MTPWAARRSLARLRLAEQSPTGHNAGKPKSYSSFKIFAENCPIQEGLADMFTMKWPLITGVALALFTGTAAASSDFQVKIERLSEGEVTETFNLLCPGAETCRAIGEVFVNGAPQKIGMRAIVKGDEVRVTLSGAPDGLLALTRATTKLPLENGALDEVDFRWGPLMQEQKVIATYRVTVLTE